MLLISAAGSAAAQPLPFGATDDPREDIQRVWWRHEQRLDISAGPSLIARQWRTGASASLNIVTPAVLARLSGALRLGVYGAYDPDVDEWYDLVRLLEFARLNQPEGAPLHLRVGLINRMHLGSGHLVNFYNSTIAWDERSVGAEVQFRTPFVTVGAFTDDVRLDGVTGGRATLRPFASVQNLNTRSFELGLSAVTDLSTHRSARTTLTGYNLDLAFIALGSETLHLAPFASFAWYSHFGSGLGFGATFRSQNFIDLGRFHLRAGLFYNGRRFIPGYIGSFYRINNDRARILRSSAYLVGEREIDPEGTTLSEAVGGTDLLTELRVVIFERFELWYNFRRHYGSRPLSEYHFRLFVTTPERLRLNVGIDRGSLGGFWSIFRTIGDRASLVFGTDYNVTSNVWLYINARYTYEKVDEDADGVEYFLVQRRFEPMGGLRLRF